MARSSPSTVTDFELRLFKALRHVKTYGIAVGMAGLSTPAGLFSITEKQVNPAWHVPNAAWAGSLAGQVIPGGAPNNPLKARWLGITDGVGIHGTAEDWSIGSRASHGCIRMHVRDVIALYPRVPHRHAGPDPLSRGAQPPAAGHRPAALSAALARAAASAATSRRPTPSSPRTGLTFTQAFVNTCMCSPSRATLLTACCRRATASR
jgi:hypothetical protein